MTDIKTVVSSTNISVNVKTKEKLKKLCKYGDSMDKIINKLIEEHEKKLV